MDKILSIILPVYNVEEYLERCIRSLEDQDIPKVLYEIIVVNDGSPDNSREIVLQLMTEFSNIIFIEQNNQGVSLARNAGINKAIGRYLLFVDPDDYIIPNTLNEAIVRAAAYDIDVMYLGYSFLNVYSEVVVNVLNADYANKTHTGRNAFFLARANGLPDPDRSWSILFNRIFLVKNGLYYLPNVPYLEDGEFIARILCLAERCVFYPVRLYIRTTRIGSATNSKLFNHERATNGFIKAAVNLKEFQLKCNSDQITFLNQSIIKFTLLPIQSCISKSSVGSLSVVIQKLKKADLSSLNLKGALPIYKNYGFFYNISPWLFAIIYTIELAKTRILNLIK